MERRMPLCEGHAPLFALIPCYRSPFFCRFGVRTATMPYHSPSSSIRRVLRFSALRSYPLPPCGPCPTAYPLYFGIFASVASSEDIWNTGPLFGTCAEFFLFLATSLFTSSSLFSPLRDMHIIYYTTNSGGIASASRRWAKFHLVIESMKQD